MIQRFTVKRIAPDYYTIHIDELNHGRWETIGGPAGQWPEYDIPPQAQARNPRHRLNKDGAEYTFYACVYHFPEPRLVGKFADYTTSRGWETPR